MGYPAKFTPEECRQRRIAQKRAKYAANKEAISAARLAQRRANPQHYIEQSRRTYARNRDRVLEQQRIRRAANPERTRDHERKANEKTRLRRTPEFYKRQYAANPEKYKTQSRASYARHAPKYRAKMRATAKKNSDQRKAYRKAHPEYSRAACHRRRAKKYGVPLSERKAILQWERAWKRKKKVKCNWCLAMFDPKKCHTDHVIPLKVGEHSIRNVCISCAPCNLKKRDKPLEEWNAYLTQPALL